MPSSRINSSFPTGIAFLIWTLFLPLIACGQEAISKDHSPHSIQFVNVENNIKVEVLDWGGSGRALVLLAGLGSTAHTFDEFAPKLTPEYHVYGITRRGFGASSAPVPENDNYSADRLGDDVLTVLDALKLIRPVLVGHSIGGEELSSIGARHPDKVAGLIYLDPSSYGFYDRSRGDLIIDTIELKKKLDQIILVGSAIQKLWIEDLLQTLPQFEKDLHEELQILPATAASAPLVTASTHSTNPAVLAGEAILMGEQKYTDIRAPVLAIFAYPSDLGTAPENALSAREADEFEHGIPSARVVRLPHASHRVFESNEMDVLREMRDFLAGLH
jgi:pimeloyl-ACP methyl ester carboxylesterase